MLDTTCGSGSVIRAAESLGAYRRERYVCLTGKNLAGWNGNAQKPRFFCPPPRLTHCFGDEFSVTPDFEQQVALFGFEDDLRFALASPLGGGTVIHRPGEMAKLADRATSLHGLRAPLFSRFDLPFATLAALPASRATTVVLVLLLLGGLYELSQRLFDERS
jgi:hypothetical protein